MNRFEQKIGHYTLVVDRDALPPNPRNGKNSWRLLLSYKGNIINEVYEPVSDFNNIASAYESLKSKHEIVTGIYLNKGDGGGFRIGNLPEVGHLGLIGFAVIDGMRSSNLTIAEYITKVAIANSILAKELHDLQAYLDSKVYGFTIYDDNGTHVISRWGYYSKGDCIKDGREEAHKEISRDTWIVQDRLPLYSSY